MGKHITNFEQRKQYNEIDSFIKIGYYIQLSNDVFIHANLSFEKDKTLSVNSRMNYSLI